MTITLPNTRDIADAVSPSGEWYVDARLYRTADERTAYLTLVRGTLIAEAVVAEMDRRAATGPLTDPEWAAYSNALETVKELRVSTSTARDRLTSTATAQDRPAERPPASISRIGRWFR